MEIQTRTDLINSYISFFKSRNHKEIPNASLVPSNDPTVLFTTAGMHPIIPYLLGQPHPLGKRLVNVQKCIRTGDIDLVGDNLHLTFFEMLGQWSLGDYFKKEAIKMAFDYITDILKIPIEKLLVTCFKGDKNAPKDKESAEIWASLGIPKSKIIFLGKEDNWWGPVSETGPCGPDTEVFYFIGLGKPRGNIKTNPTEWSEIWNAGVFMEYNKTKKGALERLKQKNVDTGMGVERTLAILQNKKSVFETHLFFPIITKIEQLSNKKYGSNKKATESMRIISDHLKASTFILADGVIPSNVERGYVLRRLIRRSIRHGRLIGISREFTKEIAEIVISIYSDYQELIENKKIIIGELEKEEQRFLKTLDSGIKEFNKITNNKKTISGKNAFLLFQSHGFPIEMIEELAKEHKIKVDRKGFNLEFKKHQELSRTMSSGVFKSGLADNSNMTKRLHTATHLLNESLRKVIDANIRQKGSNITPERLRFDFNFTRKLTKEEINKVESWVNDKISQSLNVTKEEMPLQEALTSGAQSEFGHKYPSVVSVYTIVGKNNEPVSKEICTGPHVFNTKEIGKFRIIKEEGIAAGIRRIKAVVE